MQKGMVDLAKYQLKMDLLKQNNDYRMGGAQGFCFIKGDKIIKVYETPKSVFEVEDLTDCTSSRIAFPIFYIYKSNIVYGEVMPYIKAKTFDLALNNKIQINDLMSNYDDIIREMKEFSGILMYDVSYVKNILYSPSRGFYLVDTTPWIKREYSHDYNVHYFNSAILYTIMNYSFDSSSSFDILNKINNGFMALKSSSIGQDFINIILANAKGDYHLIELLDAYKSIIKAYYHVDIKTLGDIKKYTKIMKNS